MLTIVVRSVADVLDHRRVRRGLILGVRVHRDEVGLVLELHVLLSVLHSVVDAAVADRHTGEVDQIGSVLLGLRLVVVEDGIGPSRDVVAAVGLAGDDGLAALELREQLHPVGVESDEVISSLDTGGGLLAVPEGVTDVLGLVDVQHVGVGVPSIRVARELLGVVTLALAAGAGLLDVEQSKRSVLGGGTFHGSATRSTYTTKYKNIMRAKFNDL